MNIILYLKSGQMPGKWQQRTTGVSELILEKMYFKAKKHLRVLESYFIMTIEMLKKGSILMCIHVHSNIRVHRAGNGKKYPLSEFY